MDEVSLNQTFIDHKSPFLLLYKTAENEAAKYFIKADGHVIDVGDNAVAAFDVLFKLHYCFNIEFALDLTPFYNFIAGCIFRLQEPKGCCVSLQASLSNVTLENDPFVGIV